MELFVSHGCGSAGSASTQGHWGEKYPMCHQTTLLLPVEAGCMELPAAVTWSLLLFENMTPEEKSISCCFLHINKHNTYAYNMHIILCVGHAAVSKKLKHFEYKAVISYTTVYYLTQPGQQPHFYKDEVQDKPEFMTAFTKCS